MTVINTNISALTAQNAQRSANNMIGLAMQRLSTGQRINSAKDDAAGLAISQKVTADVRGLAVAIDAPPAIFLKFELDISGCLPILPKELAVKNSSYTVEQIACARNQVETGTPSPRQPVVTLLDCQRSSIVYRRLVFRSGEWAGLQKRKSVGSTD